MSEKTSVGKRFGSRGSIGSTGLIGIVCIFTFLSSATFAAPVVLLEDDFDGLRPGMEGIAKTESGSRLVIRIWTEDLYNWLRLKLWNWLP